MADQAVIDSLLRRRVIPVAVALPLGEALAEVEARARGAGARVPR